MRVSGVNRAAWIVLVALFAICPVAIAAPTDHVNITIDGDLTDLIAAVTANPGAGCSLTSAVGNIFTTDCSFTNGFDITNGYVLVDFEAAGGGIASDFDLYAGFQVTGVIGDYDGDTDPNAFSNAQGGCAIFADEAGANVGGRTGISNNESYTVEFRDCVTGQLFRLGVKNNQVINFDDLSVVAGATYARLGSFLEISIPNLKQVFPGLDLCDLQVSLTANAEFDGLGEDRTNVCNIEVPLSIDVQKTPDTQSVCEGDPANFTITVTNDGSCVINDVRVNDTLGAGLTFLSSNPPSTGDAQNREWLFDDINLAPGQQIVITLVATATGPCTPEPFRNDVSVEGLHDVNENACPGRVDRTITDSDFAQVTCLPEPCVDQVSCQAPASACDGDEIQISGSARNCSTGPETIVIEILGPGGAVLKTETFPNVQPNATVTSTHTVIFDCASAPATYTARATASNDCGETSPVTSSGCTVACDSPPEVSVRCVVSPETAAEGDALTVTGFARNDGDRAADILLTVDGQSQNFPDVAPGVEVSLPVERTMPACTGGESISFNVSAIAENSCGTSNEATSSCSVLCEEGLCCWLTFGGHENGLIKSGNKDNTFGGNVGPPPSGSWQHIQRNGKEETFNFHSHDAHVTSCGDNGGEGPCSPKGEANVINIAGTGNYSINGGSREFPAYFDAQIDDNGEPGNWPDRNGCGTPDHYILNVYNAETNELVFSVNDFFSGGNGQIHECKGAKFAENDRPKRRGQLSAGSSIGEASDAGTPALELYRPSPNPFSQSTTIAYAVGSQSGESVQIGIYDVAGRQVRELVNGFQAPGRYQASWDGRNNDGVSVTKGVYFLRAYVGGVRMANAARILYVR